MKPVTWIGLAIIVGALTFGGKVFVRGLSACVSFSEARQASADTTVQVMGALDKKSVHYATGSQSLDFVLISDKGERLPVTFSASRPANFDEAVRITAIGSYDGKVFQAQNLLVKCPSKYQDQGSDRSYNRSAAAASSTI